MASISPAERLRREFESTLDGVGEEVDPVEAVGRVGARLIGGRLPIPECGLRSL
jgi:hypothetical protein